jgi:hypothetical protein
MWLSTDIDAWLANLPIRRIKGDGPCIGAGEPAYVRMHAARGGRQTNTKPAAA